MKEIIEELQNLVLDTDLNWYKPGISDEDKEISWWRKDRSLIVFQDNDTGNIMYLKVWGPNMYSDMEEGVLTEDLFIALWRWLYD